jgi:hypothetical protein
VERIRQLLLITVGFQHEVCQHLVDGDPDLEVLALGHGEETVPHIVGEGGTRSDGRWIAQALQDVPRLLHPLLECLQNLVICLGLALRWRSRRGSLLLRGEEAHTRSLRSPQVPSVLSYGSLHLQIQK